MYLLIRFEIVEGNKVCNTELVDIFSDENLAKIHVHRLNPVFSIASYQSLRYEQFDGYFYQIIKVEESKLEEYIKK